MVNLGPLKPISDEAIKAIGKMFKLLKNAPKDEWRFVLRSVELKVNNKIKKSDNE